MSSSHGIRLATLALAVVAVGVAVVVLRAFVLALGLVVAAGWPVGALATLALLALLLRILRPVRMPWRLGAAGMLTLCFLLLLIGLLGRRVDGAPGPSDVARHLPAPLFEAARASGLFGALEPGAPGDGAGEPRADDGRPGGPGGGGPTGGGGARSVDEPSIGDGSPGARVDATRPGVDVEWAWQDQDGSIHVTTSPPPEGAKVLSRRARAVEDGDGAPVDDDAPAVDDASVGNDAATSGSARRPAPSSSPPSAASATTDARTADPRVLAVELRRELNVLRGSPSTWANRLRRAGRTGQDPVVQALEGHGTVRALDGDGPLDDVAAAATAALRAGQPPPPLAARLAAVMPKVGRARELIVRGPANAELLVQSVVERLADRQDALSADFLRCGVACDVVGAHATCAVDLTSAF